MSFTHKPSHNIVEVNMTPETGVAVGTSRRSLKSFPPFGETTLTARPTRKDKALSRANPMTTSTPADEITYCVKHPNREATLRCIRCNRLMCTDCIVRTSVGYVCKECSRQQEDKFFSAGMQDYVLQAGAGFIVMAVVSALLTQTGFASSFLGFILGPIAGGIAGEAAMRVSGRRRGRYTDRVGSAAVAIGGLLGHYMVLRFFFLDIWFLIFLGLAVGGAYARLRGRI